MCSKVSIVIPVYNVEKYIKECVDSAINQTYKNLEIILVDDGSTDSSGKICDEYSIVDDRIVVIHRKNGGLSAARNTGLDVASGEYVYFLDSDDYIEENSVENLVNTIEKENAEFVFFDGYVFYTDCEADGKSYSYSRKKLHNTNKGRIVLCDLLECEEYRTAVPLTFFKTDYLRDNKIKFYEGILHEDELFTFQVFNANGIVAHCHEELYARRIRPSSIMTASAMSRRFESMLTIYNELAKMYKNKTASGEAATMYLIREAKSVIGKYNLLSEEQKLEYAEKYKKFKKNVMGFKGFGDMKLKIKCSGKIGNIYYRLVNKFFK